MVELTANLRKFDDLWYTIERIVYGKGQLSGFTSEEIFENLRDKSFFKSPEDLHKFLIENDKKYRVKALDAGGWERYW
jgi:hypothetical protein